MSRKPFYTVQEVAEIFNISEDTVYRHINNRTWPAHKIGHQWRISPQQLEQITTTPPQRKTRTDRTRQALADLTGRNIA
ncbi:helix-turn-helix domain-containing protein [Auritidibacter ignavus]|uniref:Helix-turn-helix domain-containing protein n=1 Tax=Auritidibacter ignavus TaxID=678932 RepID=A0AAJ6ALR0_9MICC|nr:helix-turn-helix domain-containing protein [Auritidibacter ignavus]WGH92124.1 helix-turn-helix domain-containing protein [Auritidibacter ignavus]